MDPTGALQAAAALLAALAVLIVPGLPVVLALRLRPLMGSVAVVMVSLAMITISAELGHLLSVPWTALSPLVLGLLLGAVLEGIRRLRRRGEGSAAGEPGGTAADATDADERTADSEAPLGSAAERVASRPMRPAILGGLVLGGGYLAIRQLQIMGSIDALSQTYDNVWHLNAVRHILRMGDASAWTVGGMTQLPGNESFYPALWHQTSSLITQLSGQEIILVNNILMLLVGCVLWPLGLMALVRTATAAGPLGVFLAGALAGISAAFPLSLMSWGLLLPYLLAVALLPILMTVMAHLLGLAPRGAQRLRPMALAVLLPAALLTPGVAHPQAVFAGIVLLVPVLLWCVAIRVLGVVRTGARGVLPLVVTILLAAAAIAGSALIWQRARPPQSSAVWEPNASLKEAIGQVGSLAANFAPTWVPLGVVMLIALVLVLWRSRERWLIAAWLGGSALSVATRSVSVGDLRYELTGAFYSDNYRIAAIPIVVAVPLLAIGIDTLVSWLRARRAAPAAVSASAHARHRRPGSPTLRGAGAVLVAGALMVLSFVAPGTQVNQRLMLDNWAYPHLLTADQRTLLEELPEEVPPGAVIATNAWNGSALAYAISDRDVLNVYMGFQAEPPVHLLNAKLDDANVDPEVCDAVQDLDVEYALDFGPEELLDHHATYTGLNEISETGSAEVVLQVGEAKLLRMLPCRGTDGSMSE